MKEDGYPRLCVCCKEGIVEESFGICRVCGWQDDWVQNDDPDYWGGANDDSLNDHRKKFLELRKKNPNYRWSNHLK